MKIDQKEYALIRATNPEYFRELPDGEYEFVNAKGIVIYIPGEQMVMKAMVHVESGTEYQVPDKVLI